MNTSFGGLWKGLLMAFLLGLGLGVHAQALEVTTPTELRATPALDGKVLIKLAKGNKIEQTDAQGGWVKVKFARMEGWVRLTHVKSLEAAAPASATTAAANPVTGLRGLFAAPSNRPTATTGTRGLTKEQIANAQPNPAEVAQLEKYAITSGQAEQFARSGKVVVQNIDAYTGAEK